jgi:hypothetical protein
MDISHQGARLDHLVHSCDCEIVTRQARELHIIAHLSPS